MFDEGVRHAPDSERKGDAALFRAKRSEKGTQLFFEYSTLQKSCVPFPSPFPSQQWARYTPDLPRAGKYEVRLSYSPNSNRATNVPVTITHAGGQTTVSVNQRKPPPIGGAFVSLGVFRFEKGKKGSVEISNRGVNGYVVIDAVQWLSVKE